MSGMNDQQKRLHAAQTASSNASTPEEKSQHDARIVNIMSETKKRG